MKIFAFIFIFFSTPFLLSAQVDSTNIKKAELSLQQLFAKLTERKPDYLQTKINDSIIEALISIMTDPLSFNYNFDSVLNMGKVIANDEMIKFYTWNVPYESGEHKISGIIQYKVTRDSLSYIQLIDNRENIKQAEQSVLTPDKWFGAMYYDILVKKIDKKPYYFLMGYNPANLFSNIKVLDVFYFDDYNYPFFGKPLFNIEGKIQHRLVLEYNEKASISLHYHKKKKLFIFHHLVPIDYKYKNNPMFYGPDFTFDGLEFKNKLWNLIKDVDVRNK